MFNDFNTAIESVRYKDMKRACTAASKRKPEVLIAQAVVEEFSNKRGKLSPEQVPLVMALCYRIEALHLFLNQNLAVVNRHQLTHKALMRAAAKTELREDDPRFFPDKFTELAKSYLAK